MKEMAVYLLCYLIGSITFGPLLARMRGVDLRAVGSGNIGATNVARALGKGAAAAVFLGDALKGTVAVLVSGYIFGNDPLSVGFSGICAVGGHNFSIFQGFRGGKGVATSLGVLAAYLPEAAVAFAAVWLAVFLLSKISSLSALLAFLAATVTSLAFAEKSIMVITLSVLAFVMHRSNIARLARGKEPRMGHVVDKKEST
ncbi:MAG: glycerol-3-phosphate 1-O-acyltransferase PlsY [Nitrospirae bacterium]|nr:glycerol-3-phosphate 1-O-acyltransferase PlsY [Nitrospirota bacterium]